MFLVRRKGVQRLNSNVSILVHRDWTLNKKNWKFKCSHSSMTQSEYHRLGGTAHMPSTQPWMGGGWEDRQGKRVQGGCALQESSSSIAQNIRMQPGTCLLEVSGL